MQCFCFFRLWRSSRIEGTNLLLVVTERNCDNCTNQVVKQAPLEPDLSKDILYYIILQWVRSFSFLGSSPRCSLGWAPDSRAKRTTTHRSRSDVVYLGPAPKWPTPQAGHWGLTRVSPWNDVKSYSNAPGQTGVDPGKLNERTQCNCRKVVTSNVNKVISRRPVHETDLCKQIFRYSSVLWRTYQVAEARFILPANAIWSLTSQISNG